MLSKRNLAAAPARLLDALGIDLSPSPKARFIVERENWSTKWDGTYIAKEIEKLHPGVIRTDERPYLLNNKIIHFGSQFQWVSWYPHLARSNRMACTFFHGKKEGDEGLEGHVDAFLKSLPRLDKVVTAATLIEERLLSWGVPREKLVRIPIGVDTNHFCPASDRVRAELRAQAGIRPEQFVIGSFQKDGIGWGEGNQPKKIKGPDILVEVARRLSKNVPVLVMLTGPARGYVKDELSKAGIPFVHRYVSNYLDLPAQFHLLDAYINPSREEGGPKGIIESMASGIPVVSTRVGMAPDVIQHGVNGFLHEVGDVERLTESLEKLYNSAQDRQILIAKGLETVKAYDWSIVGRMHYDLVYKPLLEGSVCPV